MATAMTMPRDTSTLRPTSNARADRQLLRAVERGQRIVYLDIETTGLSRYYDELTLVGTMIDGSYDAFILGDDSGTLLDTLAEADTIVTFNGTLFDLPFLVQTFEDAVIPPTHVDLRYVCRRMGLTGGLKEIERHLGIAVRDGVGDIDGAEAVLLWHRYRRGDLDALDRLIRYNMADVQSLSMLLEKAVAHVAQRDFWSRPQRLHIASPVAALRLTDAGSLPLPLRLARPSPTMAGVLSVRGAAATTVGIDLTGSEAKPSGFAVLRGTSATTAMIGDNDALVAAVLEARPDLVSIDSPLCLPAGRTQVEDDDPARQSHGIMRESERILKRRGINVYPCLLPSMQRLTARGIGLAARLRKLGVPVIESYPGAAQDIMGVPRKGAGVEWLRQGLEDFGVTIDDGRVQTHDELDAITCAIVGHFHLDGLSEGLAGPGESPLIIPRLERGEAPLVIGFSGRIGAGKTTAARHLEAEGFAYTRFSLVIDRVIGERGLPLDRSTRQHIGFELHEERGQAWLCEQTLNLAGDAAIIAVDGLRWPEDHAFLRERFGSRFVHVHVEAPADDRYARTASAYADRASFDLADGRPVEAQIGRLGALANTIVGNDGTIEGFQGEVLRIANDATVTGQE